MIYTLICVILCLLAFFNIVRGYNRPFYLLYIFTGVVLIFFAGFRYETGYDYEPYRRIYEVVADEKNYNFTEPLFTLINYLASLTTLGFFLVIFMMALIAVLLKFKFIRKYSPYWFISIAIYFVTHYLSQEFGQIRQGVAVAICLWALDSLFYRKWLRYFFLVICAGLMHYSAFIFLFSPLIFRINFRWPLMVICWIICFLIGRYLLIQYSQYFLLLDLGNLTHKLNYIINPKYNSPVSFSLGMLFKLFILIVTKISIQKEHDRVFNLMANLYFIGGCIYFIMGFVEVYAGRFSAYFVIVEIILLPFIVYRLKSPLLRAICTIFCIAYVLFLLYVTLNTEDANYLPYKSIF